MRLRPTFEIALRDSREAAIAKLSGHYPGSMPRDLYLIFGEYGELHLPQTEHRLWSPHLSFYVMEVDGEYDGEFDGGHVDRPATLHGRFAPRLNVWTSLWIVYLSMTFTTFFGLMIAATQWFMGETAWGLGLAVFGGSVIASIYAIASAGQRWSADQMRFLRDQLDRVLAEADVDRRPIDVASFSVR